MVCDQTSGGPKLGLLIMGTAKRYSKRYVTFVRVAVAQDQRHLLTIAKTVMTLTTTREKLASTTTKTMQEKIRNHIQAKTFCDL